MRTGNEKCRGDFFNHGINGIRGKWGGLKVLAPPSGCSLGGEREPVVSLRAQCHPNNGCGKIESRKMTRKRVIWSLMHGSSLRAEALFHVVDDLTHLARRPLKLNPGRLGRRNKNQITILTPSR
ncbi:MAG: hypothetical protein JWM99_5199 [Verrucomicrobiales bacterium]|nr:hypothetical protein [Verrucomicrobiales bacterium]